MMELAANSSPSSSPEFEFWMLGNTPTLHPSQPPILTADELFSDGVLLPLHQLSLLSHPNSSNLQHYHHHQQQQQQLVTVPPPTNTTPKKCKEMLKLGADHEKKKRLRDSELKIHIWPFMRSRSAGRAGPKDTPNPTRRVSSAPCSRSNSRGETTTTTTTTTPTSISNRLHSKGRTRVSGQVKPGVAGGIHLNRPGLMWKLRRSSRSVDEDGGAESNKEKSSSDGNKKVLNFNVKTCVGYQSGASNNGGLVKLKAFFSKKLQH